MNENENLNQIVENTTEKIKEKAAAPYRNRAERRAIAKKLGKKGRAQTDLIAETAEKLNYIELIQELRKLNEEKEKENNG